MNLNKRGFFYSRINNKNTIIIVFFICWNHKEPRPARRVSLWETDKNFAIKKFGLYFSSSPGNVVLICIFSIFIPFIIFDIIKRL